MTRLSGAGKARVALVQFPGSNCDMDRIDAMKRHYGVILKPVWHTEASLPQVDAVIIPGGFSFGDYLRSGALASHSPVIDAVKTFVTRGGAVLGICNGFQILTESHLLPGTLLRNAHKKFVCSFVDLSLCVGKSTYQVGNNGDNLRIPVAHGEGRYYIDSTGLKHLQDQGLIVYRYKLDQNPNGSLDDIAGIVSENGRVMGMMPHPERATDVLLGGSSDGLRVLDAFMASFM